MTNGKVVPLKANGENEHVKYEDVKHFMKLVKEKRMNEFNEQVWLYYRQVGDLSIFEYLLRTA